MNYIKGFTFLLISNENQKFNSEKTMESMKTMKETTGCDTMILAFGALQNHPQSEEIDYIGPHIPTEEELVDVIHYGKELGIETPSTQKIHQELTEKIQQLSL